MTSRDVADAIAETDKHKAETETYAETADGGTGKYCASAGEKHQKHGAEKFR